MKKIVIYTTNSCPYCVRAKDLLKRKNTAFEEVNVEDPKERNKMVLKAAGKRSVPQIFIGDFHVGGCDDLYALDQSGKLDGML